jgi:uncharacterized protein (PEP-CTERM system associated)
MDTVTVMKTNNARCTDAVFHPAALVLLPLLAAMANQSALAQTPPQAPQPPLTPQQSQQQPPPAPPQQLLRPLRIVPEVTIGETYTDNVELSPAATAASSWVTTVTPSIRIERTGPRLTAFVDYRLQSQTYSSQSRLNEIQNFLSSRLALEAIESFLFAEARATISQENRSAFAPSSSTDAANSNANRIETRTYQLSPFARGRLGLGAVYQFRVNATQTETESAEFPTTRTIEWLGRIRNASAGARLGWRADVNSLTIRNAIVGERVDSRGSGTLTFMIYPGFTLSGTAGVERTDFATTDKRAKSTYGGGIEYSPSPRTQFAAVYENRFFGSSQNILATHRTPRTAWRFSSTRDVTVLPNQLAASSSGTTFALLNDLLAASVVDPVARQEAVRRRFEDTGATAAAAAGGFLAANPFVNRINEGSVTLLGVRNTLSIDAGRTERRSFGAVPVGIAGASSSSDIKQDRANATWSYRLSPLSTLTLSISELRTKGFSALDPRTKEDFQSLFFTTRFGQNTRASLGARHTRFRGIAATGYSENAVVASLTYRF